MITIGIFITFIALLIIRIAMLKADVDYWKKNYYRTIKEHENTYIKKLKLQLPINK